MEVYRAKFDYEKEREDILSFKEGAKFRIASKADKKWWAAYLVETGEYGYVPSSYMERYIDPMEGENAQILSESDAGVTKRQALQELRNKIKPTPVLMTESGGSEDNSSDSDRNETTIIKPLTSLSATSEEGDQIEPRQLRNPVMESKAHMRLHKELKLNHARGGIQSILGKPELEKVMQRRRADADGNIGSIRPPSERNGAGSISVDNELATQFARRSQLVENEKKEGAADCKKPEFMKVSLRKTPQQ